MYWNGGVSREFRLHNHVWASAVLLLKSREWPQSAMCNRDTENWNDYTSWTMWRGRQSSPSCTTNTEQACCHVLPVSLSLYLCILQGIGEYQIKAIANACHKDGVKHSDGLSHTCIEDLASVQDLQPPPDYVTVSWWCHPIIAQLF